MSWHVAGLSCAWPEVLRTLIFTTHFAPKPPQDTATCYLKIVHVAGVAAFCSLKATFAAIPAPPNPPNALENNDVGAAGALCATGRPSSQNGYGLQLNHTRARMVMAGKSIRAHKHSDDMQWLYIDCPFLVIVQLHDVINL